MDIAATAPTRPDSGTSTTTNALDAMNGDAFLKLLVAQLQNQNPLEPMKNQEFMSEMTQLSSLEQLQTMSGDLNSAVKAGQMGLASSLLGRTIQWAAQDGTAQRGAVTEVVQHEDSIQLKVASSVVPLRHVQRVTTTPAQEQ